MDLLYQKISNDKYLLNIYKKIDDEEDKKHLWSHHGYSHIMNVVKITDDIMCQLNYPKNLIEMAKIAAFMHDLGCINGKENHANLSYEMTKKYFEDNQIKTNDNNMILMAIKHHSNNRILNNKIAPILRFADKLDITKDRLAKAGYQVKGMKEYQYIEDIKIEIKDDLIINFIINNKVNKIDLEKFYFTKKVFKAIDKFAKEINKPYKILYNGNKWSGVYD